MREAGKGSIAHNAWSKFGVHFFALFATYLKTREVVDEEGAIRLVTGPVISLLSVAPLHTPVRETVDSDGCLPTAEEAEVESEESCTFTVQAYFDHICDILSNYYEIDPALWLTNQTADSASVNLALAVLLGIPHVNFENHLLANEVKLWLNSFTLPDYEIDEQACVFGSGTVCKLIHNLMNKLKTNKNRAVLRKETDIAPTIGNETRWASAGNMMNKYEKIETAVIEASMNDDADFSMPPTTPSFNKAKAKTTKMLRDINFISIQMQTKLANVARCQQLQGILIDKAVNSKNDPTSHWYQNTFAKTYIAPNSVKRPDKHFVSAVSKMQQRLGSTLAVNKKGAIDKWLPKSISHAASESCVSVANLADPLILVKDRPLPIRLH
jgi:hypothetical protein